MFIYQKVSISIMSEMVHLRIPEGLYKSVEKISEEMGFKSVQEFIRQAVRDQMFEYQKRVAFLQLRRDLGGLKGAFKGASGDERIDMLGEFMRGDKSKFLKKYGFDAASKKDEDDFLREAALGVLDLQRGILNGRFRDIDKDKLLKEYARKKGFKL